MTVLANEQVIDGKGWRSGAPVERRKLAQWFLKITDFADDLLEGLQTLDDWPDKVRLMQENWIGKSRGLQFRFRLAEPVGSIDAVEVFTTRPDTIFGASFVAVAADHPIAQARRAARSRGGRVHRRVQGRRHQRGRDRDRREEGLSTGIEVVHPLDPDWRLPLYIANFVLMDYGTGALFGVPGHDQRDFEFARKYGLPIQRVVAAEHGIALRADRLRGGGRAGVAVNSRFLDGLTTEQATAEVIRRAEEAGWGQRHRPVSPARLGRVTPALLGHADPDHPLPDVRRGSGAARPTAGGASRRHRVR